MTVEEQLWLMARSVFCYGKTMIGPYQDAVSTDEGKEGMGSAGTHPR